MTLFRKNYKDAFNDIKPSEAFVNSVIEKASGKRPPAYKRYAKYAAPLAAAVIIVSAAAVSMPVWQRADNTEPGYRRAGKYKIAGRDAHSCHTLRKYK